MAPVAARDSTRSHRTLLVWAWPGAREPGVPACVSPLCSFMDAWGHVTPLSSSHHGLREVAQQGKSSGTPAQSLNSQTLPGQCGRRDGMGLVMALGPFWPPPPRVQDTAG